MKYLVSVYKDELDSRAFVYDTETGKETSYLVRDLIAEVVEMQRGDFVYGFIVVPRKLSKFDELLAKEFPEGWASEDVYRSSSWRYDAIVLPVDKSFAYGHESVNDYWGGINKGYPYPKYFSNGILECGNTLRDRLFGEKKKSGVLHFTSLEECFSGILSSDCVIDWWEDPECEFNPCDTFVYDFSSLGCSLTITLQLFGRVFGETLTSGEIRFSRGRGTSEETIMIHKRFRNFVGFTDILCWLREFVSRLDIKQK